MTDYERHEEAHLIILLLLALWCSILMGCASPKAIRDAETAANRSTEVYAQNMDTLARSVATAYREEAMRHVEYLYRAGLDAATGPDGTIARETVETANKDRASALAKVEVEYQRFVIALAHVRLDLEDSRALRAEIRAYLAAEGVGADTVQAVTDIALAKIGGGK